LRVILAWESAPWKLRELCERTLQLKAVPALRAALQRPVTVADALLLENAAASNGAAVAVPQKHITLAAGTQEDFYRIRMRLTNTTKDLESKVAGFPKKQFSPRGVALRVATPFSLASAAAFLPALALARRAKANAARAKAEAGRPGVG
jgi:hypothetical protein